MITLQVVCCLLKLRHVLSLKEIKCTKLSIYIAYKHASHDVAECAECYNTVPPKNTVIKMPSYSVQNMGKSQRYST